MSDDIAFSVRCAARLVAAVFDLPPDVFTGERKGPPVQVHARQVLCHLLHTAGFEQSAIADELRRHRSTVGHAIGVVEAMRNEPEIDQGLHTLTVMLHELRAAHARLPSLVEELAP